MVNHIASDPEQLLRALAGERLGTSEEALSNPIVSASSGALSTAIGATIPINSVLLYERGQRHHCRRHYFAACTLCGWNCQVADYGAVVVVFGFEMTVVGALEGAVTYGIGVLLGKGGM